MPRKKDPAPPPQLPRLTYEECARVLGISKVAFMEWLSRQEIGNDSLLKWSSGARPVSEWVIRAYLSDTQVLIRAASHSAVERETKAAPESETKGGRGPLRRRG